MASSLPLPAVCSMQTHICSYLSKQASCLGLAIPGCQSSLQLRLQSKRQRAQQVQAGQRTGRGELMTSMSADTDCTSAPRMNLRSARMSVTLHGCVTALDTAESQGAGNPARSCSACAARLQFVLHGSACAARLILCCAAQFPQVSQQRVVTYLRASIRCEPTAPHTPPPAARSFHLCADALVQLETGHSMMQESQLPSCNRCGPVHRSEALS